MNEINLTLPPVPSLNNVYRNVRINLRIITQQGRAWKEEVHYIAMKERVRQKWQYSENEKLIMELKFYWRDARRRDSDNCIKLLSDTLQDVLYRDDKFVLPRVIDFQIDRENPRCEVRICKHSENS